MTIRNKMFVPAALCLAFALNGFSGDKYWRANSGGWDYSTPNWASSSSGAPAESFVSGDDANFVHNYGQSSSWDITLNEDISANSLYTEENSGIGYNLALSGSALNVSGATTVALTNLDLSGLSSFKTSSINFRYSNAASVKVGSDSIFQAGSGLKNVSWINDQNVLIFAENKSYVFDGANGGLHRMAGGASLAVESGAALLIKNSASSNAWGGAIYSERSTVNIKIALEANASIEFAGNKTDSSGAYGGGAIYASAIPVEINGGDGAKISFTGNEAVYAGETGNSDTQGGAIRSTDGMIISVGAGGLVEFKNNRASSFGGAISSDNISSVINISAGTGGTVLFEGNTSEGYFGGAIRAMNDLNLTNASFINNSSTNDMGNGGAIKVRGNMTFTIDANRSDLSSYGNSAMAGGFIDADNSVTFDIGENSVYAIGKAEDRTKDSFVGAYKEAVLVKKGAGTLVLNADSGSWYGKTEVDAGTLVLNGKWGGGEDDSSANFVTVNSGGILGGSGKVFGTSTVKRGGTLAPGSSPGRLTFETLVLEGGSILEIENGDSIAADAVSLDDSALNEQIRIVLAGFEDEIDGYRIFEASDFVLTGDIDDYFVFEDGFEGQVYMENGGIYVKGAFVPEPASYAAIFGALVLAFAAYRRRKK